MVGMSGGVDSAVAAALLLHEGWRVVGVTLRQWNDPSGDPAAGGCCSLAGVEDARRTCAELGIEHYTVNALSDFSREVVDPFVDAYAAGRTPNPCVVCNVRVRFRHLLSFARKIGASRIGTGHYVRVRHDPSSGRYQLLRGRCAAKDQSYMLYRLSQEQLAASIFPLGELETKDQTRALAQRLGLSVASRRESQDICFVSRTGFRQFIVSRAPSSAQPGPIIDEEGRRIGTHQGVAGYTIGQRRGLPATGRGPLYVTRIDAAKGVIHAGPKERLFTKVLVARDVCWVSIDPPRSGLAVSACIRYNAPVARATVEQVGDAVRCVFDEPQRAVTPGQSVVFYDGERVQGGGIIAEASEAEIGR